MIDVTNFQGAPSMENLPDGAICDCGCTCGTCSCTDSACTSNSASLPKGSGTGNSFDRGDAF